MKILFFSAKPYDKTFFEKANGAFPFHLEFLEMPLGPNSVNIVEEGTPAVCAFVNDQLNAGVIEALAGKGVEYIALRCAGFNNVDLDAARTHHIRVCRVPAYSPEAVAEHAVAMLLTLNRKTHKAYNRVREQNFALDGLLGFNIFRKTVGVIGTGKIGQAFCKIMFGFGAEIIAYDPDPSEALEQLGVRYVGLDEVLSASDILSLHCPLNERNKYLINKESISRMKRGVALINTSRGALLNTRDVIDGLKSGHIGYLGIDVYEQEEQLFFRDLSARIIEDDMIQRLMSFPNVLVTGHQAFFTEEALTQIAETTLRNLRQLREGRELDEGALLT